MLGDGGIILTNNNIWGWPANRSRNLGLAKIYALIHIRDGGGKYELISIQAEKEICNICSELCWKSVNIF
jgi:hypothetical protein